MNVGIVSNSTKHIASTVAAPEINNAIVQQNGPSSLPTGAKNGKRAGVVIVTDKDLKENGKHRKWYWLQIIDKDNFAIVFRIVYIWV